MLLNTGRKPHVICTHTKKTNKRKHTHTHTSSATNKNILLHSKTIKMMYFFVKTTVTSFFIHFFFSTVMHVFHAALFSFVVFRIRFLSDMLHFFYLVLLYYLSYFICQSYYIEDCGEL